MYQLRRSVTLLPCTTYNLIPLHFDLHLPLPTIYTLRQSLALLFVHLHSLPLQALHP